tara:strand:+ start:12455 stop:13099 length:645 start_codon:yes stop_codon:yes gene_type:complete
MDELEILKKDWKEKGQTEPKLSYNQIYNMLFKRSTSIVKWIFIISILELVFWMGIFLITPKSSFEVIEKLGATPILYGFNILHYLVVFVFIYYFYKNYTTIKVTDNTKTLMRSILKTRKTVRYFVIYNLVAFALTIIIINIFYYTQSELLLQIMADSYGSEIKNPDDFITVFFIVQVIAGIVMILLLLLFYRLIYGILLGKLKRNYRELERIEV